MHGAIGVPRIADETVTTPGGQVDGECADSPRPAVINPGKRPDRAPLRAAQLLVEGWKVLGQGNHGWAVRHVALVHEAEHDLPARNSRTVVIAIFAHGDHDDR